MLSARHAARLACPARHTDCARSLRHAQPMPAPPWRSSEAIFGWTGGSHGVALYARRRSSPTSDRRDAQACER